jgi:hypothetical protein
MEQRCGDAGRGKQKDSEENLFQYDFSTTDSTVTALGANLGLSGEKVAFNSCEKSRRQEKIILLMFDGHTCLKSTEAVELVREPVITLLTLQPHATHKLRCLT